MATESPSTSSHTKGPSTSATPSPVKPSFSRCIQCSRSGAKSSRNIIVCIDGTSNQFGQKNTNIVKLFAKIDLEATEPEQHAYYSSGIGTSPKSMSIFRRMERQVTDKFEMAIAWNMEEIVKDAYGWLARTYHEGDRIYLFGFSRGAYQVRLLAAMINEVGLIRTPTDKQIGTAYDYYEAVSSTSPKTRQIAREFKNTFSWKDLRVHFVGVWDTVSSVGLIRKDVFLSSSSSAVHACHFRHALALDERRVKFMPEYFHEMNCQSGDSNLEDSPESKRRASTVIDSTSASNEGRGHKTEIKEVWFAGCHSDVGGTTRPGTTHQAGNVSLLWMRREAAAEGLVLLPTDLVWVPDDLDFGTSESMSSIWKAIEYLPIKHQTSFSGTGDDTRRLHAEQPRRIIPGQKVHASVLYANAYKPIATLGEGFDLPIIHAEPEDTDLDDKVWESGLFDCSAADELLRYLASQQGVAPVYLDRLLFMLRFKEGKECVRNIHDWKTAFRKLVLQANSSLVRLVALVAYYEAAYDTGKGGKSSAVPPDEFDGRTFDDAKRCLESILAKRKHRDGPRVVALLRPLAKHQILRERILTPEVLDTLINLLDKILQYPGTNFGQAMNGLSCLLQCKDLQGKLVEKLKERYPRSVLGESRLSRILKVDDSQRLAAALRMVLTFARIPEVSPAAVAQKVKLAEDEGRRAAELAGSAGPSGAAEAAEAARKRATDELENVDNLWSKVKPRLRHLAGRQDRLVGRLAVEVLFALHVENEKRRLNLLSPNVRANVASALIALRPKAHDSSDGQSGDVNPERQMLQELFGFGKDELNSDQKRLTGALGKAVKYGNARERTAATLTLLNLCETKSIRAHLRQIGILSDFINQLQQRNSALLAAYALAECLKHEDMKTFITSGQLFDELAKKIVGMLRLDYFDDAVGPREGFQIFRDFMSHGDLRDKIKSYNITEILDQKLGKGKRKEIRTSLICLEIFHSHDPNGPWAHKLVEKSLRYLKKDHAWKTQKAGVMILSGLAQTERGVGAISKSIPKIVRLLLPEDYQPMTEEASAHPCPADAHVVTEGGTSGSPAPLGAHLPIEEQITAGQPPDRPVERPDSGDSASPPDRPIEQRIQAGSTSSDEGRAQRAPTSAHSTDSKSTTSLDAESQPSSWMMGPACALRILAQNEALRKRLHLTQEYSELKNLHLTGTLVSEANTSAWRVKTPNRDDVTQMLDKVIKAVDAEISEEGLMSIGDTVLPHIAHWDRLMTLLRDRSVVSLTIFSIALSASILGVLAAVAVPPIVASRILYSLLKEKVLQRANSRILDLLLDQRAASSEDEDGDSPSESGVVQRVLSMRRNSRMLENLSGGTAMPQDVMS